LKCDWYLRFIYTIEAARCLAAGEEDMALRLLEMARNEVQAQVDD
jgi:hypothetical protein